MDNQHIGGQDQRPRSVARWGSCIGVAVATSLAINPFISAHSTHVISPKISNTSASGDDFQQQLNEYLSYLNTFLAAHDTPQTEHWLSTLANNEQNPNIVSECLTSSYCTIDISDPATRGAVTELLKYYELEETNYRTMIGYDSTIDAKLDESINDLKTFLSTNGVTVPSGPGDDTGGGDTIGGGTAETGTFTFSNGLTADPNDTIGTYSGTVDTSPLFGFVDNTHLAVTGLNVNTLDLDGDGTPIGSDTFIDIDGDGTPLGKEADPSTLFNGMLPTQGSVYDVATFNFLGTWEFIYVDQDPLSSSAQKALSQLLPADVTPGDLVHPGITAEIITPFSSTPIDVSWLFQSMESLGIDTNSLL